MKLVSFVIPCYRSEKTIRLVVDEIRQTMDGNEALDYEIILINDCSPDATFKVISELANEDKHIVAVDLVRNFGQHAALMAGYRLCKGDYIVSLDDDGQSPANEVMGLIEKIEEGYDVVYASYNHKQHSAFRNWGSHVNDAMTRVMLGKPKEIQITSYFVTTRTIINEVVRYEGCYPYVIGLVLRTTKKICNVPVHHRRRESGRSGYTLGKLFALWMNGFTSFSVKPLRLSIYCGVLSAVLGFLYLIYIIVGAFLNSSTPMGWRSLMVVMLMLGGIILIVLGIVGEYVGRIYMCVNSAPQYVIRKVFQNGDVLE